MKSLDFEFEIPDYKSELEFLKEFVLQEDYTEIMSETPVLSGAGVGVVRSGVTYNFFGIKAFAIPHNLSMGQTYTLIRANQYEPLTRYTRDKTYAAMWIDTGTSVYSMPLKIDNTGLTFTVPNTLNNLPAGTVIRFTVSLVILPDLRGMPVSNSEKSR
jgi:hypothetical protein